MLLFVVFGSLGYAAIEDHGVPVLTQRVEHITKNISERDVRVNELSGQVKEILKAVIRIEERLKYIDKGRKIEGQFVMSK
jgi:hypothetical protein